MSKTKMGFSTGKGFLTAVDKATEAEYASSDHSKGTIEERLTALGFKQGTATVSLVSASVSSNLLKRQGNYVIGKLNISEFDLAQETQESNGYLIGTIPANFLPKETTQLICGIQQVSYLPDSPAYQTELYGQMTATIYTNGNIYLSKTVNGFKYTYYNSKWNKGSETASTLSIASTISEGVIYGLSINFAYEAAALR